MDNYAWQVIQRERDKMADLVTAKKWLKNANTVIVTAGNGMAKEEGLDILSEEGFDDQFGKIADKYDVHTIGMH